MNRLAAKKSLREKMQARPEPQPAPPPANSRLERKKQLAASPAGQQASYAEINRIVGLPVVLPMEPEEREAFNKEVLLANAYRDGFRLFAPQADGILQFRLFGGLLGPIGVGWGKTLMTLETPSYAYSKLGVRKMMLMAPTAIMPQLLGKDIQWARGKVPITYPVHVLYDKPPRARRRIANSDLPGLYIMPYSLLSAKDASEILEAIRPEMIVADEVQNLKDQRSARTKRVMHYVREHGPIGVGLSGTITSKSIRDYWHLARWCLGDNCPLPTTFSMAQEWATVLDAEAGHGGEDPSNASTGPLAPLVRWAREIDPKSEWRQNRASFRRAFQLRLTTSPGVVASSDNEIKTGLMFENRPVREYETVEGWTELDRLIKQVEDEWVTPNGDEIEHAIHTWKWLYELSAGFYNELVWPEDAVFADRRRIPEAEAADILQRAREHHAAQQDYASRLRQFLEYESRAGMDTPMLVGQNMAQHGGENVPDDLYRLWRDWKNLDFEGRPERDANAIRVCPYKIHDAVAWAGELPKGKGGIIWVHHQEIGRWARDLLMQAGIDCQHCPAGREGSEKILDPANAGKVSVASIASHGTGKNLQHYEHQYVLQWPRPATTAEQFVGRTHRNGQKADEIVVTMSNTIHFDELNFAACVNDALYIHQTTGTRQKLIIGSYNPLPRIFPPEVLIERGLQNRRLSKDQERVMAEKFGNFES